MECTNVRGWGVGGGVRWATASCLWFTRLLLFCPPLCLTGRPDCLGSPPPAPAIAAAVVATIITAQISVLRSQLHRSHNLDCPLLLPHRHPTAQTSDSRATPPPLPPERQQLFPLHACAPRHTSAPTGGHMGFSSSPFPFSHIIQFLPLLFTLRKIPWTHDLMKA